MTIVEEWTSLVTCKPCVHGMWSTTVSVKEYQSTDSGSPNRKRENGKSSYTTTIRNFQRKNLDGTGGQQTDKLLKENCIERRSQVCTENYNMERRPKRRTTGRWDADADRKQNGGKNKSGSGKMRPHSH